MKQVYTTGQVAKICNVASRTVSKWFDAGKLRGYCIPYSRDRRITRVELVRFLKEHGMPLGGLDGETRHRILIVGAEPHVAAYLQGLLPESDYVYQVAESGFDAGVLAETFHPDAIVIDLAMGRSEAMRIAQSISYKPQHEWTFLVALACEDDPDLATPLRRGFDEVFQKPLDFAALAERIRAHVEEKAAITGGHQ